MSESSHFQQNVFNPDLTSQGKSTECNICWGTKVQLSYDKWVRTLMWQVGFTKIAITGLRRKCDIWVPRTVAMQFLWHRHKVIYQVWKCKGKVRAELFCSWFYWPKYLPTWNTLSENILSENTLPGKNTFGKYTCRKSRHAVGMIFGAVLKLVQVENIFPH